MVYRRRNVSFKRKKWRTDVVATSNFGHVVKRNVLGNIVKHVVFLADVFYNIKLK